MKTYSLKQIDNLIDKYVNSFGGEVSTLQEGVLGYGLTVLHGAKGKKSIIIKEIYVNEWSSTHTVKMYNSMPKKYQRLLNDL